MLRLFFLVRVSELLPLCDVPFLSTITNPVVHRTEQPVHHLRAKTAHVCLGYVGILNGHVSGDINLLAQKPRKVHSLPKTRSCSPNDGDRGTQYHRQLVLSFRRMSRQMHSPNGPRTFESGEE